MAARLEDLNPNAEIVSKAAARAVNVAAAQGLQGVLKTNLGPRGPLKMLVGGAGQIKLTKDGNVLLHEMQVKFIVPNPFRNVIYLTRPSFTFSSLSQIQHPTACMVARTATAQDDVTGDGTTSTVLLCGELLKQAERYASEGLHPRVITDGFDKARDSAVEFLDTFKIKKDQPEKDRELLTQVANTSLRTKLEPDLADVMTEAIVDAVQCVAEPDAPVDLHMVEIMHMQQQQGCDSRFVNGIVLDHGGRHPDMPKVMENCYIMTCNVTFEYEKTEVQSGFFYSSAEEREKLVESERKVRSC